jgi:hypothetical protein
MSSSNENQKSSIQQQQNNDEIPIAVSIPDEKDAMKPIVVEGRSPTSEEWGICRRCRREFRRPPGVNDGQAQYYRCPECSDDKVRWNEFFSGSCIIA